MIPSQTNRSMTPMQSEDLAYKHVRNASVLEKTWWGPLVCLALSCLFLWGCSGIARQVAKKDAGPEQKLTGKASKAPADAKNAAQKANPERETETKVQKASEKKPVHSGRTELETVRDIAIGLAKKHAPVHQMRLCYAKKTGEWWITLFQDDGHALDLKQYIWNKSEDKINPYCVEKRIAKDALEDYLSEHRRDRECTAFEYRKNKWNNHKARSTRHGAAIFLRGAVIGALRTYPDEDVHLPDLVLVSGEDKELALRLTNVSTSPRGGSDYVFLYGSEMNHTDLLKWLRKRGYDPELVVDASAGKLEGYGFVWNYYSAVKGGGTANIEPREGSVVWGLVLEVDGRLISALDKKQGSPVTYTRGPKRIPVRRLQDGRTVLAWVYTAKPNRNGRTDIWPTREYKKGILEAASFWGFPRPYVETIQHWHTRK